MMQVTSDYYRCRAQRAAFCAESLTLSGEDAPAVNSISNHSKSATPLCPSSRTLRGLEKLHKSEKQNRVA
jgi:hypothetical protein